MDVDLKLDVIDDDEKSDGNPAYNVALEISKMLPGSGARNEDEMDDFGSDGDDDSDKLLTMDTVKTMLVGNPIDHQVFRNMLTSNCRNGLLRMISHVPHQSLP